MLRLFPALLLSITLPLTTLQARAQHQTSLSEDLGGAYGYYVGQALTLERIAARYPALSIEVTKAQLGFDLVFKPALTNLDKILEERLGQRWPETRLQSRQRLEAIIRQTPLTYEEANEFIRTVNLRSQGQIESPVLETLLAYTPAFQRNPSEEFLRSYTTAHRTGNHPKAKDIDFQIRYPKSWKAKEGQLPDVIQLFASANGRGQEAITLVVQDLALPAGYKISSAELDELFSAKELRASRPAGAVVIAAQPITWDRRKGGMVIFDHRVQQLDAGAVAGLVGNEGGVVSEVINLESSGV
ncbi:MAG: hypothetical protein K2Z80_38070, partial [Xanthobacteraceae bacterium]|nr:hypothetical protein [Xanthobacteraceae bacterium]